jgi:hypothetical protein
MSLDHRTDHIQRPQGKPEVHLQGVLTTDGRVNPPHFPGPQFPRSSAAFARVQRVPTATAIPRQPTVERRPRYPQGLRQKLRTGPVLNASHGSLAQIGQGLRTQLSCVLFHESTITTSPKLRQPYFWKINKT